MVLPAITGDGSLYARPKAGHIRLESQTIEGWFNLGARSWDVLSLRGNMGPAATAAGIKILRNGGVNVVMMMSPDQGLLSAKASLIWIPALCAVLVSHCGHMIRMRGEHRWYHCAHIVMLIGMLYMYAAVAFGLNWLPAPIWMIVYVATAVAIIAFMLVQCGQRHAFALLWVLALIQQAAMVYMWVPMAHWVPKLSYALTLYFALEATAWLTRAYSKPLLANAVVQTGGLAGMPLAPKSVFGNVCMMIMAASMAYMFAGMQLMMPAPRQSERLAKEQATQTTVSGTAHEQAELPPPAQVRQAAGSESEKPSAESSPPALAGSYAIVAGDSLGGIAARLYGDARQWGKIIKANPGLNPRRLRIGQVIKLPVALSSRPWEGPRP
jgi:LysM repeat protein